MFRRVSLSAFITLAALLLGGCAGLWGEPRYQVTLQMDGLANHATAQTVSWVASSSSKSTMSGVVPVIGQSAEIPISLAPGSWQITVELRDGSGDELFADTKQLTVRSRGQVVTFDVSGSGEDTDPSEQPQDPEDPPTSEPNPPQDPEDPPVSEPGPPWKAWNGDLHPAPTGMLQGEKSYQTPYYVIDSGVAGPVMLITGGMHGDEPAGSLAAWELVSYHLKRGKLIVIPELNSMGLKAGSREGGYPGDPNRDYPREQGESADDKLSKAIWQLLKDEKVTWLMDLHEGYSYHKINSASVGQSIIHHKGSTQQHKERDTVVNAMLEAANELVAKSDYEFSHLHNPVTGSLARAAGDQLGIAAMTIETCDKQPQSLRIQEHETMVSTAMRELGML